MSAALTDRRGRLLTAAVASSVAVAFADSSIVVLALPNLYGAFNTTIVGVAWVITSYNVVVAMGALALAGLSRRLDARRTAQIGLAVFAIASVGCAVSWSLAALIAFRCVQGLGAALLLAASLPLLGGLIGSRERGTALWTTAAVLGAALGPVLGGVLTQLFDWRAIFVVQTPVAAVAFVAARGAPALPADPPGRRGRGAGAADVALALVFAALVGALFLAVLLVITVWGYSPIGGAALVSSLPAAALAVRPLERRLPRAAAVWGGAALLAGGLVGLALLPSANAVLAVWALALCGAGLGLAVPLLSQAALDLHAGLARSGTFTVGVRHLGLVLALASIAPLLASEVPNTGDKALLKATAVLLDSPAGLDKKVPVALDLRGAFAKARDGETPDLSEPFNKHGARTDSALAETRDKLVGTIEATITRAFRPAFFLSAAFAALALAAAVLFRRRLLS